MFLCNSLVSVINVRESPGSINEGIQSRRNLKYTSLTEIKSAVSQTVNVMSGFQPRGPEVQDCFTSGAADWIGEER